MGLLLLVLRLGLSFLKHCFEGNKKLLLIYFTIKIFINHKGTFAESDIPASTGLWQTIVATDVNGDGFTDILAGNWGHNNKLWAGKNGPVKMYVKDFDGNGTTEQILCYTINGEEYTFLAKDELERALPVLKKAYLKYNEVAGKSVQYLFFDLFKNFKEFKAEELGSSVFINDGKGGFARSNLPEDLQMAPIMAFAGSGQPNTFMAGGNFYGVIPYEGRYDALFPTAFAVQKTPAIAYKLPEIAGEVRDIKWLRVKGGQQIMVIARNNMPLLFLQKNN